MSTHSVGDTNEVLGHLERFAELLDEQMRRNNSRSFTVTDQTGTVEVTIDSRQQLTGLEIEDGLLRLGADTVKTRVNEALRLAQAEALAGTSAEYDRLVDSLAAITDDMVKTVATSLNKLEQMGKGGPPTGRDGS